IDRFIDSMTTIGIAIPNFWFALILMIIFGNVLNIFPITGMYTVNQDPSLVDYLRHLVLPCLTLVIGITPEMIRYVRVSTINELVQEYVLVQKAYGNSYYKIITVHVFKNVLIPIITIFASLLPMLVTGAFVTETIFSWPGVGPYFLQAINGLDYPIIMAVLLLSSTMVIIGNLIADILYCIVDPRIKELK
ncbi:MAG: ABC transporter permease, partial [Bacilli bacterium]